VHEWIKSINALNNSNVSDAYSHDSNSSSSGKSELTTLASRIKSS
jgi:hypothetical protein